MNSLSTEIVVVQPALELVSTQHCELAELRSIQAELREFNENLEHVLVSLKIQFNLG